jgi:hypothetical protein
METSAWKVKIPIDRVGGVLSFELKELGIDEYMAIETFIEKKKWAEALIMFFGATRIGGDELSSLKAELDRNNLIPFIFCMNMVREILEPVAGEVKKS